MPEIGGLVDADQAADRRRGGRFATWCPTPVLRADRGGGALPRGGDGVSRARARRRRWPSGVRREPGRVGGAGARIAAIVDDKKGEEIVAIDVRELVSYTDYLVIATARNERQAKAIADEVRLRLKREHGLLPARAEGEARGALGAARLPRLRPPRAGARDARPLPARAALGRGPAARARARGRRGVSRSPRRGSVRRRCLASRAVKAFKRSLFGYRRAEVERALDGARCGARRGRRRRSPGATGRARAARERGSRSSRSSATRSPTGSSRASASSSELRARALRRALARARADRGGGRAGARAGDADADARRCATRPRCRRGCRS